MIFRYIILIISTLCILYSCAVQTPPTGGPKDEDPPILINSIPENRQTNYTDNMVFLYFNEWVVTGDFKNQLLITPTYRGEFDVDVKKTEVIIEFDTAFDQNTTYTLNFRQGIKDITEGNVPEELRLAFSTGDKLDSLSISGNIKDHIKDIPLEKMTVALYDTRDTLNPLESIPKYFTKTNTLGNYRFENIKDGNYKIYTFNDANNDLLLDTSTEKYGFRTDTLNLDTALFDIDMTAISLNLDTIQLSSARQNGEYFEIKFSKYVDSLLVAPLNDELTDSTYYHFTDKNQTLRLYYTFPIEDSVRYYVYAKDSINTFLQDTLSVTYSKSRKEPDPFKVLSVNSYISDESTTVKGTISFSKPVSTINKDSIRLYLNDSILVDIPDSSLNVQIIEDKRKIELSSLLSDTLFYKKDTINNTLFKNVDNRLKPQLIFNFNSGSFISIEGDSAEVTENKISYRSFKDFGIIRGTISNNSGFHILQLVDQNYEVIRQLINPKEFVFKDVKPGTYQLRILVDTNSNKNWDPGNFFENILPEPVIYYENIDGARDIIIRPNWEQIDINIQYPPVDNTGENVGN